MRALVLLAFAGAAAGAGACGDDDGPPRPEPKVRLALTAPADSAVVRSETVRVRGTVQPGGARVEVAGREVGVDGGGFDAEVKLEPGANLIDVAASANGRRPDFAAMRIVREVRVPVPDVTGGDADTAREQLEALGLEVRLEQGGGLFEPLLPGDPKVCTLSPDAGTQVLPGTEVTAVVARDC